MIDQSHGIVSSTAGSNYFVPQPLNHGMATTRVSQWSQWCLQGTKKVVHCWDAFRFFFANGISKIHWWQIPRPKWDIHNFLLGSIAFVGCSPSLASGCLVREWVHWCVAIEAHIDSQTHEERTVWGAIMPNVSTPCAHYTCIHFIIWTV